MFAELLLFFFFFSMSFMVKGLEFLADAASEQPFAFRDSGFGFEFDLGTTWKT